MYLFCAAGIYASEQRAYSDTTNTDTFEAVTHQKHVPFADFSKGPLFGKNMYIPFLIHYNFPSVPAKSGKRFDLQCHFSAYYINDTHYKDGTPQFPVRQYDKQYITRDYESWVAELGFAYNIQDNFQLGLDLRLFSFYAGSMDSFIEAFHGFFGFPNGLREFFLQNQIYINIPNNNGITIFLDKPATSFGDIDLWGKWTFFENKPVSLAALGAFKLPTGKLEKLSGSGYPDAGLGLLMDFRANRYLSMYTQAGLVLPFNGKSHPMFSGLLGLEVHPWQILSLNLQMDIKSSPIRDNTIPFPLNDMLGTNFFQYSLPQINLLGGVVVQYKGFRGQLNFEQDPFTNQGTDITFCLTVSYTTNLEKLFRSTGFPVKLWFWQKSSL